MIYKKLNKVQEKICHSLDTSMSFGMAILTLTNCESLNDYKAKTLWAKGHIDEISAEDVIKLAKRIQFDINADVDVIFWGIECFKIDSMTTGERLVCESFLNDYSYTDSFKQVLDKIDNDNDNLDSVVVCELYAYCNTDDLKDSMSSLAMLIDLAILNNKQSK